MRKEVCSIIPPCPHCGHHASVVAEVPVTGRVFQLFDAYGRWLVNELDTYEANYNDGGIVCSCDYCGEPREDLQLVQDGDSVWLQALSDNSESKGEE